MKNKFNYSSFYFAFLLLLSSCSKFEKINVNPDQTDKVPSHILLNNIMYSTFGEDGDVANQTGLYSTFVGGDMGGCWAQHFGKVQYNDEERYQPRVGVVQDFWETMYEDVCLDATDMYNIATKENNKVVQGVALVLKAYGFQVLTDCYGDIPFSEALKGSDGNFSPKYDAQENVYKGIIDLLTEADGLLASNDGVIPAESDRMYGGDATKWRKLANSLKFRALMRISSKSSTVIGNIPQQLQAIVTAGNIFTSVADDAKVPFGSAQPAANPFYETITFGQRQEWMIGEQMVNVLKGLNDDRLAVYAQKNKTGQYLGKPAGYASLPSADYNYDNMSKIGLFFIKEASTPAYYISYSQLQLLMAEARQKGLISTGSAKQYYDNGVSASYESVGLGAFNPDGTLLEFNSATALNQIALQEWIALYGQGVEAWNEWKRNRVPALPLAVAAYVNEIPSRYLYPTTEQSLNGNNYRAAIAQQGPDELTTKIWWLKP
jgi:hypothetical protein